MQQKKSTYLSKKPQKTIVMQSVCVCYNLFFSKVNLHLPPIYCLAAPTHRLTVGPLRNEDTTVARDMGRVLSKALGNGCCSAIRFLTKSL